MTKLFISQLFFNIVVIACLTSSCGPARIITDEFTKTAHCYDGNNKGLDNLLEITKGYYHFIIKDSTINYAYKVPRKELMVSDSYFYFMKDGFFFYANKPVKVENGFLGSYYIAGDTIKARFMGSPGDMTRNPTDIWFQIINRKTLKEVFYGRLNSGQIYPTPIAYQNSNSYKTTSLGKFVTCDTIPDPDKTWLKKKKWFWCNEEEYNKWRAEVKAKRSE